MGGSHGGMVHSAGSRTETVVCLYVVENESAQGALEVVKVPKCQRGDVIPQIKLGSDISATIEWRKAL